MKMPLLKKLELKYENLKAQFPKGQASGENITINDSSNLEFDKFKVIGNSYQETSKQGKNLLDARLNVDLTTNDSYYIKVKPSTQYTLTVKQKLIEKGAYIISQHWIKYYNNNDVVNNGSGIASISWSNSEIGDIKESSQTITTPENCNNVMIDLSSYAGTYCTVQNIEAMFSEGEKVPYEPFVPDKPGLDYTSKIKNCGKDGSINFKTSNENLFNPENSLKNQISSGLISINDKGQLILNGELSSISSFYTYIKKGTYLIKENTHILRAFWDGGDYYFDRNHLITISEDSRIFCYINKGNYTNQILEPMIYKTDTFDENASYIPSHEQSISFPLEEGQVLHKNDYLSEDGIHQKRITRILDGSEIYVASQANENYYAVILNDTSVPDSDLICDKLKVYEPGTFNINSNAEGIMIRPNQGFYLVFNKNRLNENLNVNEYIRKNNITVEYDSKEERIIPYTEAQRKVFNQLKELHTYKGTTHIYSTDEVSPNFEVEYSKDLETILKG